jgi:hypothetical protein
MSEVEEGAFSPTGYQVFLGNLPFAMDEGQLEQLITGKAERCLNFRRYHQSELMFFNSSYSTLLYPS